MTLYSAVNPYPVILNQTGSGLNGGRVYVGLAGQDPQTFPQQVYWDAAGTIPAVQPLTTIGGYIWNAGTPAQAYPTNATYSIRVLDRFGQQVFYEPNANTPLAQFIADLASTASVKGAGLVGFSQTATYPASTSGDHLKRFLVVTDHPYLAPVDGTTDATSAIQAAIDSCGAAGGDIIIPRGVKLLIDNTLTVKPNCHLVGPHKYVGSPKDNTSADYGAVGGALILNSTKTITVKGGASVSGVLIYRKGMTFPAADSSAFVGTAITAGGDDVSVASVMILGFDKGFYSSGYQRPRLTDVCIDCINGVEITNCADIAYLTRVHCWPFATIAALGAYMTIIRSGIAFYLHDLCDWAHLTDCFSYGYQRGVKITNANSVQITSCGADNVYSGGPLNTGSKGIEITGTSSDTRIVSFSVAAQYVSGIEVNTDAGKQTLIIDLTCWGGTADAVTVTSGDVQVTGGIFGGLVGITNGVTVNNASSYVFVGSVKFATISNRPINPLVATTNILIGKNDYGASAAAVVAGSNLTTVSVASASAISAPSSYDVIDITGTTNIGTVNGGWAGRCVTLVFGSALTVLHSTGGYGAIRLSGAANFAVTAGGSLTLRHNGTQWVEMGRAT